MTELRTQGIWQCSSFSVCGQISGASVQWYLWLQAIALASRTYFILKLVYSCSNLQATLACKNLPALQSIYLQSLRPVACLDFELKHTHTHTHAHTHTHTYTCTHKHTHRQRQTDRQTDRQKLISTVTPQAGLIVYVALFLRPPYMGQLCCLQQL